MNKFKFYFILFSTLVVLFSCKKTDDPYVEPLRDFDTQYSTDKANIIKYLETHYISSYIDHPGFTDDQNITFTKMDGGAGQESLMSLLPPRTTYPMLKIKTFTYNEKVYEIYYLILREGSATEKPTPLDNVLTTYKGYYLTAGTENAGVLPVVTETLFEDSSVLSGSSTLFPLYSTIRGWQEIMPMFGKGTYDETATGNGSSIYQSFGAGVMFIPSGFAYFNQSRSTIPSYSPLMFQIKLLNFQDSDLEYAGVGDGIMSKNEIVRNADGSFTYTDTDGDGTPDYLDFDDDNDGYPTKKEIEYINPIDPLGTVYYYSYDGAATDDPATPFFDESRGIPDCSGNFNSPTRVRKYLDKTCH